MLTLTYGLKQPQTGDTGASLWTSLEANIAQLDAHTHDGVTSPNLTAASIVGVTASVASGNWATYGGAPTGFYRQQLTLPAGFDYDTVQIGFRDSSDNVVLPTVEKVSDTQFLVYSIDNTETWTAIYGG